MDINYYDLFFFNCFADWNDYVFSINKLFKIYGYYYINAFRNISDFAREYEYAYPTYFSPDSSDGMAENRKTGKYKYQWCFVSRRWGCYCKTIYYEYIHECDYLFQQYK